MNLQPQDQQQLALAQPTTAAKPFPTPGSNSAGMLAQLQAGVGQTPPSTSYPGQTQLAGAAAGGPSGAMSSTGAGSAPPAGAVKPPFAGMAPPASGNPNLAPAGQATGQAQAIPFSPVSAQAQAPPASAPTNSPIPLSTGSQAPYANATTNTPGGPTDYLNKTITPGAGVDRLALAKSNFENFRQSTDPEYRSELNTANQAGYGAGQGGSGMLRGRLGDIATTRARDLQTAQTSNLNQATEGSIGDQYRNLGIAQQQQGFQAGQQNTAFNQGDEQARLQEMLTGGAYGRAANNAAMGFGNNPADTQLQLAGDYGRQASAAGAGAGGLASSAVTAAALKHRSPYDQLSLAH